MKAIITRTFNARGDRERPRFNAALTLTPSDKPQTLPRWAILQAVEAGCAEVVEPKRKKKSDAESETGE